jgi:hypothetical protein
VVGDPIRTGGGTTELTTALRADYDVAAAGWTGGLTGPGSMYEPLARSLVAAALAAGARRVVGEMVVLTAS